MKYLSVWMSSRDSFRHSQAGIIIFNNRDVNSKSAINTLSGIRDKKSRYLNRFYLFLQHFSGIIFLVGSILTLAGVQSK